MKLILYHGTSEQNAKIIEKERRRKISESKIGIPRSEETKRKISNSHKGIKNQFKGKTLEEICGNDKAQILRLQYSLTRKGRKLSEETKDKISKSLKGRISPMKDKLAWNKGKSGIYSKETINKISNALKGRKLSDEVRKKMSEGHKGIIFSEEHKLKLKKILNKNRWKLIIPLKDTKIEVKIQDFLKKLNYKFFPHYYMNIPHSYPCDIFIPKLKLVIECDGNYWHNYPIGNNIDHIRTKELNQIGLNVLRLWESEIKSLTLTNFQKKLTEWIFEGKDIMSFKNFMGDKNEFIGKI
jgi:very-short-patch-repair endonuclease